MTMAQDSNPFRDYKIKMGMSKFWAKFLNIIFSSIIPSIYLYYLNSIFLFPEAVQQRALN